MCKELSSLGLPQKDIARMLGITEAAVSHYMNAKRAAKINFDGSFRIKLKTICNKVVSRKMSAYDAIQILSKQFKRSGALCHIHKQLEAIPAGCQKNLISVCRK